MPLLCRGDELLRLGTQVDILIAPPAVPDADFTRRFQLHPFHGALEVKQLTLPSSTAPYQARLVVPPGVELIDDGAHVIGQE
jgi:hypothetical protein